MVKFSIFVGDLSAHTNERDLEVFFSQFGVVGDVRIVRDRITYKSLLYGFVDFQSAKAAADAIQATNGFLFKGRAMRVKWANSKSGNKDYTPQTSTTNYSSSTSVYVTFQPLVRGKTVSESRLRSIFEFYGIVTDATIRQNKANNQIYGFIRYTDDELGVAAALKAAREVRNVVIDDVNFYCDLSNDLRRRLTSTQSTLSDSSFPTNSIFSKLSPFSEFQSSKQALNPVDVDAELSDPFDLNQKSRENSSEVVYENIHGSTGTANTLLDHSPWQKPSNFSVFRKSSNSSEEIPGSIYGSILSSKSTVSPTLKSESFSVFRKSDESKPPEFAYGENFTSSRSTSQKSEQFSVFHKFDGNQPSIGTGTKFITENDNPFLVVDNKQNKPVGNLSETFYSGNLKPEKYLNSPEHYHPTSTIESTSLNPKLTDNIPELIYDRNSLNSFQEYRTLENISIFKNQDNTNPLTIYDDKILLSNSFNPSIYGFNKKVQSLTENTNNRTNRSIEQIPYSPGLNLGLALPGDVGYSNIIEEDSVNWIDNNMKGLVLNRSQNPSQIDLTDLLIDNKTDSAHSDMSEQNSSFQIKPLELNLAKSEVKVVALDFDNDPEKRDETTTDRGL